MMLHIKILFLVASLFFLMGCYNFAWKTKSVDGVPYMQYRRLNLAWCFVFLAFLISGIAFILN